MTLKSRLQTAVPIALMLVLAVIVTNVFPFRVMLAQNSTVELAQAELVEIDAENAELERQIAALSTKTSWSAWLATTLGT